jgi:hypothetical protein
MTNGISFLRRRPSGLVAFLFALALLGFLSACAPDHQAGDDDQTATDDDNDASPPGDDDNDDASPPVDDDESPTGDDDASPSDDDDNDDNDNDDDTTWSCQSVYNIMYNTCSDYMVDGNGDEIAESQIVAECESDENDLGLTSGYAQCIEDHSTNCQDMETCLGTADDDATAETVWTDPATGLMWQNGATVGFTYYASTDAENYLRGLELGRLHRLAVARYRPASQPDSGLRRH